MITDIFRTNQEYTQNGPSGTYCSKPEQSKVGIIFHSSAEGNEDPSSENMSERWTLNPTFGTAPSIPQHLFHQLRANPGWQPLTDCIADGDLFSFKKNHASEPSTWDYQTIYTGSLIHFAIQSRQHFFLHQLLTGFHPKAMRILNRPFLDRKQTPLHLACELGDFKAVAILLRYGAEVNLTDGNQQTPLNLATGAKHFDCAKLLRAAGAQDSYEQNNNQKIPKSLVFHAENDQQATACAGIIQGLDEAKILPWVKRVEGCSIGAVIATLMALDCRSYEVQEAIDFFFSAPSDDNDGTVFRSWLEEKIDGYTGKKDCTFRELKQLIKNGKPFKHLAIQISFDLGPTLSVSSESSHQNGLLDLIIADVVFFSLRKNPSFKGKADLHVKTVSGKIHFDGPVPSFNPRQRPLQEETWLFSRSARPTISLDLGNLTTKHEIIREFQVRTKQLVNSSGLEIVADAWTAELEVRGLDSFLMDREPIYFRCPKLLEEIYSAFQKDPSPFVLIQGQEPAETVDLVKSYLERYLNHYGAIFWVSGTSKNKYEALAKQLNPQIEQSSIVNLKSCLETSEDVVTLLVIEDMQEVMGDEEVYLLSKNLHVLLTSTENPLSSHPSRLVTIPLVLDFDEALDCMKQYVEPSHHKYLTDLISYTGCSLPILKAVIRCLSSAKDPVENVDQWRDSPPLSLLSDLFPQIQTLKEKSQKNPSGVEGVALQWLAFCANRMSRDFPLPEQLLQSWLTIKPFDTDKEQVLSLLEQYNFIEKDKQGNTLSLYPLRLNFYQELVKLNILEDQTNNEVTEQIFKDFLEKLTEKQEQETFLAFWHDLSSCLHNRKPAKLIEQSEQNSHPIKFARKHKINPSNKEKQNHLKNEILDNINKQFEGNKWLQLSPLLHSSNPKKKINKIRGAMGEKSKKYDKSHPYMIRYLIWLGLWEIKQNKYRLSQDYTQAHQYLEQALSVWKGSWRRELLHEELQEAITSLNSVSSKAPQLDIPIAKFPLQIRLRARPSQPPLSKTVQRYLDEIDPEIEKEDAKIEKKFATKGIDKKELLNEINRINKLISDTNSKIEDLKKQQGDIEQKVQDQIDLLEKQVTSLKSLQTSQDELSIKCQELFDGKSELKDFYYLVLEYLEALITGIRTLRSGLVACQPEKKDQAVTAACRTGEWVAELGGGIAAACSWGIGAVLGPIAKLPFMGVEAAWEVGREQYKKCQVEHMGRNLGVGMTAGHQMRLCAYALTYMLQQQIPLCSDEGIITIAKYWKNLIYHTLLRESGIRGDELADSTLHKINSTEPIKTKRNDLQWTIEGLFYESGVFCADTKEEEYCYYVIASDPGTPDRPRKHKQTKKGVYGCLSFAGEAELRSYQTMVANKLTKTKNSFFAKKFGELRTYAWEKENNAPPIVQEEKIKPRETPKEVSSPPSGNGPSPYKKTLIKIGKDAQRDQQIAELQKGLAETNEEILALKEEILALQEENKQSQKPCDDGNGRGKVIIPPDELANSPVSEMFWTSVKIRDELWMSTLKVRDNDFNHKVRQVNCFHNYLAQQGYKLKGVESDGNCFFYSVLSSYKSQLNSGFPRINLLDSDDHQALREKVATLSRNLAIAKDGKAILLTEGLSLVEGLGLHIRTLSTLDNVENYSLADEIASPRVGTRNWADLLQADRPQHYLFIVDLDGHFVYAQRMIT